jgi:hypothetical protein
MAFLMRLLQGEAILIFNHGISKTDIILNLKPRFTV